MKTRKEYIDLISAKMDEIDARIKVVEAKAATASEKMKIKYNEEMRELSSKREKAEAQWEKLKKSTDDAWDDVKRDADMVIEDVKRFFKGDKAA